MFTFLSFFPFFLHVNTKLQETTYIRRERERGKKERESVRRRAKMMEGAAVAMISALVKTRSAIEASGRSSPSDKARRLDAFCVENYAFLCTGTCIVDYARRVYSEPRADRGLKCQPRAGLTFVAPHRDRNKEKQRAHTSPLNFHGVIRKSASFAFPFFSLLFAPDEIQYTHARVSVRRIDLSPKFRCIVCVGSNYV